MIATSIVVMFGVMDHVLWLRAMIPHHSIAIMTSERNRTKDPRVRELIEAQRREIGEMKALISELERQ